MAELFLPSELERLERESGGHTPGYTAGALDVAWKDEAEHARTMRHVTGIVDLTLGAGSITAGALIEGGAGDLSGSNRTAWSVSTFVAGGFLSLAGVASLLVPSQLEKGYQIAFPSPALQLDVAVAPVPGGGALQIFGSF